MSVLPLVKNGGNMGASGSVSYLFDNKGVIVFAGDDADAYLWAFLLEADVDVRWCRSRRRNNHGLTAPTDLHKAIVALRESGVEEFQVTELEMIPQSKLSCQVKIWKHLKNFTAFLKTTRTYKKSTQT